MGGEAAGMQQMLQAAVQSVDWTYSLFWQLCPQQRVLVWANGYYNGAIKTRKTTQPAEVTAEEAALERSQQLRELYETLLAGESSTGNVQATTKRACTALSPEDLTETEWFYLMCVSFSFPPPSGVPGKAYAGRKHVWLSGANEVDSRIFSRAILAKSAKIQTVVCIPLLDGVVELGTTDKVKENLGFIDHIKSIFNDNHSKPALSEHSTSNPSSSSFPLHITFTEPLPDDAVHINAQDGAPHQEEEDEEIGRLSSDGADPVGPRQLMIHADAISEEIRLGSPDDVSNNLQSDFHVLAVCRTETSGVDSVGVESTQPWLPMLDQLNNASTINERQALELAMTTMEEDEGGHYSQTVSALLQAQATSSAYVSHTPAVQSSFVKWRVQEVNGQRVEKGASSQWVLKFIIFNVPFLHIKNISREAEARLPCAAEELNASHVVAERRRREKLNERFITLRSMVPFVTKMDKVSILGDTIEYVKQLRKRIHELEARNRQMEMEMETYHQKRMRTSRGGKGKTSEVEVEVEVEVGVEVSIIESDALLEMRCEYREGLLLDILQVLKELGIETTAVHTTVNDRDFAAEIRAKVRGKKASIAEVKRVIYQIIPGLQQS